MGKYSFPIYNVPSEWDYEGDIKINLDSLRETQKKKIDKCLDMLRKTKCTIISDTIEPHNLGDERINYENHYMIQVNITHKRVITYSTADSKVIRPAKKKFRPAKPDRNAVIYEVEGVSVVGKVYSVETDGNGLSFTLMVHKDYVYDVSDNREAVYYISCKGVIQGSGRTVKEAYRKSWIIEIGNEKKLKRQPITNLVA